MSSKPRFVGERVKLGEVVGIEKAPIPSGNNVWLLNLDAIEKDTGRVLEKNRISPDSVGTSTIAFTENAVLYSKLRPNLNKVVVADEPGLATSEILPLISKSEVLDRRYLAFLLRSKAFVKLAASSTAGSKMPRLNKKTLLEAVFPLPDPETQRWRVELLTSIEKEREKAELQIANLDSLVKSRFVEMFENEDYRMRPMGDLVESITAGTNVGGQQRPLEEGEYGVLKISAVTQGVFNPGEFKVVDDVSRIKMIHPRKGDLLFSRANTTEMVGATAIVDKDYGDLFLPDKLWRLDPADEVETVFLKALLSSPSIRAEMSKVSTGSSGSMQNISMAKFRKLPAFLPPLALQQEFAAFVSQVDKSRFVRDHEMNFRWERFTLSWSTIA